jgi:hypothetical protein
LSGGGPQRGDHDPSPGMNVVDRANLLDEQPDHVEPKPLGAAAS